MSGQWWPSGDTPSSDLGDRAPTAQAEKTRGVQFFGDGRAYISTPPGVVIGIDGHVPPQIDHEIALDLEADDARRIFEETFERQVPPDKSPQEALSEELRGQVRSE